MPHTNIRSCRPAVAALVILLAACIGLAACGSSKSPSTSSSTNATAASSSVATNQGQAGRARGGLGKRFAAIRACMSKNGITLPQRPAPGQRPKPGSPGTIPGLHLPKGMTQAQYQAIVKKCGFRFRRGGLAGGGALNTAAGKQALAKFATCMHENGVPIPAPNTSGTGPIFSSKGLNTSSPQFRAAEIKCRSDLVDVFRAHPGASTAKG